MDKIEKMKMMKPSRSVGIIGYGAYVPRYRLPATEISRIWRGGLELEPIQEKSVPGTDEDVVTMSVEAARNALMRISILKRSGRYGLGLNPTHMRLNRHPQ